MANIMDKGDTMADLATEVKDALELGGIATGFTLTTPTYALIDAYAHDGTKLEIRVEIR